MASPRQVANNTVGRTPEVPEFLRKPLKEAHSTAAKAHVLADFAARMTCLFWFETDSVVRSAGTDWKYGTGSTGVPDGGLPPPLEGFALPGKGYVDWVAGILSTTQVTPNVVLLALLFIYRLRVMNSKVQGRPGSEFRLLMVALMLGNKFLDDNTYTNKTWAEVSGMSVSEVHVMEVEFLSNMRYGLYASKGQWETWLRLLGRFNDYCELAGENQARLQQQLRHATSLTFSPLQGELSMGHHRSPTATLQAPLTLTPVNGSTRLTAGPPSPLRLTDSATRSGKRRHDDDIFFDPTEPAPKRQAAPARPAAPSHQQSAQHQQQAPPTLRVSIPSISTSMPQMASVPHNHHNASLAHMSATTLPPLAHGVRAMATVFAPTGPSSASTYAPQAAPPMPTTPVTAIHAQQQQPQQQQMAPGYSTPTRQQQPSQHQQLSPSHPLHHAGVGNSFLSSPLAEAFGQQQQQPHGTPTLPPPQNMLQPQTHSPSVYLQQRASPYRPVRHVNTLLFPVPRGTTAASSLFGGYASVGNGHVHPLQQEQSVSAMTAQQQQQLAPLAHQRLPQMHYQPLGRRNDVRPGVVPEYLNPVPIQLYHLNNAPTRLQSQQQQQQHPAVTQQQQQHRPTPQAYVPSHSRGASGGGGTATTPGGFADLTLSAVVARPRLPFPADANSITRHPHGPLPGAPHPLDMRMQQPQLAGPSPNQAQGQGQAQSLAARGQGYGHQLRVYE